MATEGDIETRRRTPSRVVLIVDSDLLDASEYTAEKARVLASSVPSG
jgi:hypothetical protein